MEISPPVVGASPEEGQPTEAASDSPAPSWGAWREVSSGENLSGLLLAVGMLLISGVLLRANMRRRRQAAGREDEAEARVAAVRAQLGIGGSPTDPVDRAQAEAAALSRRLAAAMENRAARIELLLEDADLKIAELEASTRRCHRVERICSLLRDGVSTAEIAERLAVPEADIEETARLMAWRASRRRADEGAPPSGPASIGG